MNEKVRGKPGRKKWEVTPEVIREVEGLRRIFCSLREIAAYFDISETTLRKRMGRVAALRGAVEKGAELAKVSLRRRMWEIVEGGGPKAATMAIFLAKNELGYSDRVIAESGGEGGAGKRLEEMSDEELMRIAATGKKVAKGKLRLLRLVEDGRDRSLDLPEEGSGGG